ncbi:bifunctional (p)ppGpp synthetase/guanosine-3',5'-bis(diphosphate) 3'-pyrophosphohydrolase [bacterium]|nr:bifunctional (p)ppGpp synthetase/guanosine-3',5'-bis(diphosphate) 3'-pyrophosphohydrolase [bacterium]
MEGQVRPPDRKRRSRTSLQRPPTDSEERVPVSPKAAVTTHEPVIDGLLERVLLHNPKADVSVIRKAYEFAKSLHTGQKRSSGEPYILHPFEVSCILADYKLDTVTIATGLLHDTVEDTATTTEEIQKQFGTEIAGLVEGLTKISKITFHTSEEKQAENFRKMILAMAKDIRVILVKLADRLHNMRTLQHLPPEKQVQIASETLDIYSPIANRLGLSELKRELEDLGLRFTKPEAYYKLVTNVAKKIKERESYTSQVQEIILKALKDHGQANAEVSGRPKHFYSIHKKMEAGNLAYDQVYDITGFRVIVDSIEQCYGALGVVHSLWTPIPGRFKDYIAMPKENFYQSLHTTVIGPEGERIEIQIRTLEMDETAERGIAAHWAYKESGLSKDDKASFAWLNRLMEWNRDLKDPAEFLESVKLDLFSEEVYIFTPQGKLLSFPTGATPLDFAYAIHTNLGNRCMGAKVDNRLVPLKYKLKSGDTVEILTSPTQRPNKDWLKIVHTSRAKNKIRQYIKVEEFEKSKSLGETMLDREMKRLKLTVKSATKDGSLQKVAEGFTLKTVDDLLSAVGYGKLSVAKIITKLAPKTEPAEQKEATGLQKIFDSAHKQQRTAITVKGLEDLLVRFARCCNPVPGDSVIGFITRGRGISVHSRKCPKIFDSDPHRLVDIEWDHNKQETREVKIRAVCEDRSGLLADLSKAIRDQSANIIRAQIGTTKDKKAVCLFAVSIHDLSQLRKIISTLEGVKGVISVTRVQRTQ